MRTWRFVTLMLTALAMSIAFCRRSSPTRAGLAAAAADLLVRGRRPALGWTVFAAACLLGAQAVWWAGVVPVNAEVAALGALVLSVIGETPRRV